MQEKEALMHCNPTRRTFLKGTAATRCAGCCGHLLGGRVAGRAGRGRRHGRGQDSGRIAVQRLLQQVRPDRHRFSTGGCGPSRA